MELRFNKTIRIICAVANIVASFSHILSVLFSITPAFCDISKVDLSFGLPLFGLICILPALMVRLV